ncbi:MAG TPA: oxidoreductase [Bacteroidota bacterium]|nr:oxidoreductase [Bacteroidota bacterium]
MKTKTALIVGASGLVGGQCLDLLLEDDAYRRVNVVVRRPLPLTHPKINQHIVDFGRLQQHSDILDADHVFCCLGTTIRSAGSKEAFHKVDFTYVVQTAALASRNGAQQFLVVSSLGANPASRSFYLRVKGEMEDALRKLSFSSIRIFRPSLLLGNRPEFRVGEWVGGIAMRAVSIAMVGNLKRYRAIEARTVAQAMVGSAKSSVTGVHVYESEQIQELGNKGI